MRLPRWGRWIALLPALVCACSLEGLSDAWDASSTSTELPTSTGGAGATGGGSDCLPGSLACEAEDCNLSGSFVEVPDPMAHGTGYVVVPEESDCDDDRVECPLDVSEAGTYQIKARLAAGPLEGEDSSFWIRVDFEPSEGYRYEFTGTEFHFDYVNDSESDTTNLLTFALEPGTHIVSFACREDGSKLDSVELVRISP
ncbi:hypothetical protein [Sorangium cellulosum]|uniref:hypothetical protein n=1 Tax=Sorangium cellulosum TaxID=56 RepID=UPI001F1B3B72|nr:hypothetical protein [Sorangium cellulosum]